MVERIITKINSSVTQMSQRLKSLADSDNDLAEQDSLLSREEAPKIVRSLRTRISHSHRREITVASVPTQIASLHVSVSSALNPNATAINPRPCKNIELNPNNVPLSSETNHDVASDFSVNSCASNTCRESMNNVTARDSQIEACSASVDGSKNSMRVSLPQEALSEAVQRDPATREFIIAYSSSEGAPGASVGTC